jgi:protocatechuate 4,5-dioxygenase, beta chain
MATIVAGIGSSHVPSIGRVFDMGRQDEPAWKPLFDNYRPVNAWLADEVKADTAIVIYNDHGADFFLDKYPTFALGVSESFAVADEGFGARPLPPVPGDPMLAMHLANSLVADEFDITVCQEMALDHGAMVPLPLLWSHRPNWAVRVIPIFVNVIQHPLPTAMRCFKLGRALRRAVQSFPEDRRVAVVGTGGMSHQLHDRRFGHLNETFDQFWLDQIESDPARLARMSHREIMEQAGAEAVELIMWLIMRGAMADQVRRIHRRYYAPMTTGMGLVSLQDA